MKKVLVQCDFDGTITEADISFMVLDAFAQGNWRAELERYKAGEIPVGAFNTLAFAMVKADKPTLLDYIFREDRVKVRKGFTELVEFCSQRGMEFVIVSNGLDFYIEAILEKVGLSGIPVHAARSRFNRGGMTVQYIGPDGAPILDGFKETYAQSFLEKGNKLVYIGNGNSDIYPARKAHHVFAVSDLLNKCRETKLDCVPFEDLADVVKALKRLKLS